MDRLLAYLRALVVLVSFCAAAASATPALACTPVAPTILQPIHIADVARGTVRRDRGLVIENGRIVREFKAQDSDAVAGRHPNASRVDGGGAYAMPGLFDMHVHALWDATVPEPFFRDFLRQGVTSVRDMGGMLDVAVSTRAAIEACDYTAPNLWFSGTFLDGPEPVDPSMSIALATPEQALAAVRRLHASGVDFIKVYSMLSHDILDVVMREASAVGLRVAGHVPASSGARGAVFRMASVEHMAIEIGGYCPASDRQACDPVLRAMIRHRVAQTPTLAARVVSTRIAAADFADPPMFAALPAPVRAYWIAERANSAARATDQWQADRAASIEHSRWMLRELNRRDAMILAGSDAGTPYLFPGASLHEELALMVEAGLTPRQALAAATVTPAHFFARDDLGRIQRGAVADIVLLDANPLEDIAHTRRIRAVYRAGARVDR